MKSLNAIKNKNSSSFQQVKVYFKIFLKVVAEGMRLDTREDVFMWKDRALVELNIAILHSFQVNKIKNFENFFDIHQHPLYDLVIIYYLT